MHIACAFSCWFYASHLAIFRNLLLRAILRKMVFDLTTSQIICGHFTKVLLPERSQWKEHLHKKWWFIRAELLLTLCWDLGAAAQEGLFPNQSFDNKHKLFGPQRAVNVSAGKECIHICVDLNPLTPLFKKQKSPLDISANLLQTTSLTRQKRRQRNCRWWWGGSSQKRETSLDGTRGRPLSQPSLTISSDEEDQHTVTTSTATKMGEEGWTVEIKSADRSPAVKTRRHIISPSKMSPLEKHKMRSLFQLIYYQTWTVGVFLLHCSSLCYRNNVVSQRVFYGFSQILLTETTRATFLLHSLSGLCWEVLIKSHHVTIERLQLTD